MTSTIHRLLYTLSLMMLTLSAPAQKQQDFAGRYMQLYAEGSSLTCQTVSPTMMQKMLQLTPAHTDDATHEALKRLKSIRLVTQIHPDDAKQAYDNALTLAHNNPARYRLQKEQDNKKIFARTKGKHIIEVVLISLNDHRFNLVDLTGIMPKDFVESLIK